MAPLSDLLPDNPIHQRITARLRLTGASTLPGIPGLDTFSVYELDGEAGVSQSYEHTVTFVSDRDLAIEALCDTEAELILSDEQRVTVKKSIFGRIFEAAEAGSVARKRLYRVTIVSPLRYLEENRRSEIYQDKSVPEIITEIIGRYDALLHLKLENRTDPERFPKRHYTTQYAQSDFDFITMLCEEEGLVLLVDPFKNTPYTLTLCELNEHAPVLTERIGCSFNRGKAFKASAQVQDYFDTYKPSVAFKTETGTSMSGGTMEDNASTKELRTSLTKQTLRDRLETLNDSRYKDLQRYSVIDAQKDFSPSLRIQGRSGDLDLHEGSCVTLYDPKVGKEVKAIILKAKYEGKFPNALDELAEESKDQPQYSVVFEAVPQTHIYRPQSEIPLKPYIEGVLTAIVSGGDSDTPAHANEIDVNAFGEIRVIFHFDANRPTSRYVPLSTLYAGDGYGAQFLPRVNSEVIVSFIGGDPDRPVIVGSVHNGENRQPYELPKEKTKSFIKTQTTPQYEDEEGYNELLFEDRQGEELLSIRAQKDYSLHVLNDASTHIEHDEKTIIGHDMQHTIQNDRTETVGNDYRLNVTGNKITTVEKEQLTTVKADRETHLLSNDTEIVGNDRKTIIEQNLIERIKGQATRYVEKDQKEQYLSNLFAQIGKDLGIQVAGAYHLTANSIKKSAKDTILYEAPGGVSLKVGGNVVSVEPSGIFLNGVSVDTMSGNGGVSAGSVTIPPIDKPLYNKLRVTALEASVSKQDDITETLTYTATVEKFEDGAWAPVTELEARHEAMLQWYFVKNNDEGDEDILTDEVTDDSISIEGLKMTITLDPENIHRFGHAHCFVADKDMENGHALTELVRTLDVTHVKGKNVIEPDATESRYRVFLNVEDAIAEEIATLKVKIVETNNDDGKTQKEGKVENDLTVTHTLEAEHDVIQLDITVYPEGKEQNYAKATTHCRPGEDELYLQDGSWMTDETLDPIASGEVSQSYKKPAKGEKLTKDPKVKIIQSNLKRMNINVVGKPDGYFGSDTEAAVKLFQEHYELPKNMTRLHEFSRSLTADGVVGKNTLLAIDEALVRGWKYEPTTMKMSEKGKAFLKAYEKLVLYPYDDKDKSTPKKKLKVFDKELTGITIGYGHLIRKQAEFDKYKDGITQTKAEEIFESDLEPFEKKISNLVKIELKQHEFDALVMFAFNIGGDAFERSSALKMVNDPKAKTHYKTLEEAWLAYNKSGGKKMQGLVNRRKSEYNTYTKNEYKRIEGK